LSCYEQLRQKVLTGNGNFGAGLAVLFRGGLAALVKVVNSSPDGANSGCINHRSGLSEIKEPELQEQLVQQLACMVLNRQREVLSV
jgi:hypothetical protein